MPPPTSLFHRFSLLPHHPSLLCYRNSHTSTHPSLSLLHPSSSLHQIKQAHAQIITAGLAGDIAVASPLLAIAALSPAGSPDYALAIFDRINNPNTFARNTIIRGFANSNTPKLALLFHAKMCHKNAVFNNYTFPFLLKACSQIPAISEGEQIHARVIKLGFDSDLHTRNALIHLYGNCRKMVNARQLFDEIPQPDIVAWNAILFGYVKDGQIEVSDQVFDKMPERDVVSWSTMISGYVQSGCLEKGLELHKEMIRRGVVANEATLVTVLSATAQLGLLEHGRLVHSSIVASHLTLSFRLGTALVDMYAKCGSIDLSRQVFDEMPQRDVSAWNAMICGLATHGHGVEALTLFKRFVDEGLKPTNVTFVGVLNACSRAGLVKEGWFYFESMLKIYDVEPEMEHYGCMVDLLGRAGFVTDAQELIEKMTISPDPVLWGTLLGACKLHGFTEFGEKIGKRLIELDPNHDGHYVLLAGIYAKARKWDEVAKIRRLMVNRGTKKVAGWSLIEAQGEVHRFVMGDREHPLSPEIYEMMDVIGKRLKMAGYSPDISPVLHDIEEEEKENVMREHSERLAIAFGLLVTEVGGSIRIVKNLRVCGDCHEVTKMISMMFEREIIVRDGSRFHHFKGGKCSCVDYW